jgi:hypothetical protein
MRIRGADSKLDCPSNDLDMTYTATRRKVRDRLEPSDTSRAPALFSYS